MYSEEVTEVLKNRIGFGTDNLPIEVDEENKIGATKRTYSYYHRLVNLKNIYQSIDEINASKIDFNKFLLQLKLDCTKSVLTQLLHKNEQYRDKKDYSDTILDKAEIFDDCIGYSMAITCIEMFISSNRINSEQRNAELKYDKLKIELEGYRDASGNIIATGIKEKYQDSINDASKILFPNSPKIYNANAW